MKYEETELITLPLNKMNILILYSITKNILLEIVKNNIIIV